MQGRAPRLLPYAAIVVVVIIIAVFVVVKATQRSSPSAASRLAPATVVRLVTRVAASAFEAAGAPSGAANMTALPAQVEALTKNGTPQLLYVGAEYCPYCAAERWPLVIALTRFGAFSGLGATASAGADVYPNTATFSFHGSRYSSPYLAFTAVETETNQPSADGGYTALQALTAEQERILRTYDGPPYLTGTAGAIPFGDLGGRFLIRGASYDPGLLQGLTMAQVAAAVADPTGRLGQALLASANRYTAALCQITHGRPGAVCGSPVVRAAAGQLPTAG